VCSEGQGCWQGRYTLLGLGPAPHRPRAWLTPIVVTRVWMHILVLRMIFYCWEGSFAALHLYDSRNHSPLFLLPRICCEGSQDWYVCPGTTKPLHEHFCLGGMRWFGEWSLSGVRLLRGVPACGGVLVAALLRGLERGGTVLCSVSFKDLLGVKGCCYILTGDRISREVPPAPAVLLALPGQGGFEDLYLVCWKSD